LIPDLLKMSRPPFPLLILALSLLHLAQATTCNGDSCPTGLIISGGQTSGTNIETFPTQLTSNCTIPPFPLPGRVFHSLSVVENGQQLVACGGRGPVSGPGAPIYTDIRTSCISWHVGQDDWTDYATLSQERHDHAGVVLSRTGEEKIILIGGTCGSRSASRVCTTGEIVKGGTQLTLQHSGFGMCAIPFDTGFVTIGGYNRGVHGRVDRYDSEGKHLFSLPNLAIPRQNHACTAFMSRGEKALLVAGGFDGGERISSTEIFSNGRWTTGGNLPRPLQGLKGANVNQNLFAIGGQDDEYEKRNEVLQFDVESRTWTQIGTLGQTHYMHAIAEANLGALCHPVVGTEGGAAKSEEHDAERSIVEQFKEQKRFIAEQFEEQKRFITEQFEKYFD